MKEPVQPAPASTVDEAEIQRFSALADTWWDPQGKMGVLHKFNPVRLAFIRDTVARHFGRDPADGETLKGLRLLDIGCGGGLLCEPMARLGADVVGADASPTNIEVARIHRDRSGVAVDYREATAEGLAEAGETFDVVLNMEVIEHVADTELFMRACTGMVRPGGLMFVATINRTAKAFALAPANVLAPFSYFQILSAVAFGLIVFHDIPDLWTVTGIVMIMGAGIYVFGRNAPAKG